MKNYEELTKRFDEILDSITQDELEEWIKFDNRRMLLNYAENFYKQLKTIQDESKSI